MLPKTWPLQHVSMLQSFARASYQWFMERLRHGLGSLLTFCADIGYPDSPWNSKVYKWPTCHWSNIRAAKE